MKKIYTFLVKYGTYSIFAGQLWGVTRTFISFPAGAMHMNLFVFIVSTALGGALFSLWIIGWSIILTGAAGLLLRLLKIITSLSPWTWPALLLCAAALVYLFFKKEEPNPREHFFINALLAPAFSFHIYHSPAAQMRNNTDDLILS